MMSTLFLLCAGLSSYAGFAGFALAMQDHWESAGGDPGEHSMRRQGLRRFGVLMLCIALALCVWRDGASFGILLWVLLMTAGGIAVALTFTWHPHLFLWCIRTPRRIFNTARSSW